MKKKKIKLIIIIILLCSFISVSYAIYRSSTSGTATIQGASWSVSTSGNNDTINLTSGSTQQAYTLTVNNNSEVDVSYSISLSNLPDGVKVKLDNNSYVQEDNNQITFNDINALFVNKTTTRNHTLTFTSILDAEEVSNQQISINVLFKQILDLKPSLYIENYNKDNISTTDHENELRLIGSNPNNYVTFNNQTWRIIGVFNGKLKLISPSIGGYSYDTSKETVNNGYGVNAWEDADLMKLLNPGYSSNTDLKCKTNTSTANSKINCGDNTASAYEDTNPLVNNSLYWDAGQGLCYTSGNYQASSCDFRSSGLTDSNSKNMIDNATWYLGSNNKNDDLYGANQIMTASYLYNMERSSYTGKQCSNANYCSDTVTRNDPPTWTGKVGLLYPSDYAYATSGGNTYDRDTCLSKQVGYVSSSTTPNWNNTFTDCLSNDWLFTGSYTWTLSPRASSYDATYVFYVATSGNVNVNYAVGAYGVRPVVYLKSNVKITGGEGTSANPFVLSYE